MMAHWDLYEASRERRVALGGCVLWMASLGVGCSASDRPGFFSPGSGGSGGGSSVGGAGGTGAAKGSGNAGAAGTRGAAGSTGSTGTTGSGAAFNPSSVYVAAPFVSVNKGRAIAPVAAPNTYIYGFPGAYLQFRGALLLYLTSGAPVIQFVPDVTSSPAPDNYDFPDTAGNDKAVASPPCSTDVYDYKTGPNSQFIYQCVANGPWYENSKQIYEGAGTVLALGLNGLALVVDNLVYETVSLSDQQAHPIADVDSVLAIHASGAGFHLVSDTSLGVTLVNVDSMGVSKTLGAFPAAANQLSSVSEVLASDDSLYVLGETANVMKILRFTVTGQQTVMYSAQSTDYLDLSHAELITGP